MAESIRGIFEMRENSMSAEVNESPTYRAKNKCRRQLNTNMDEHVHVHVHAACRYYITSIYYYG